MQYASLGHAGLRVSRICLGCMAFGPKAWRDYAVEEPDARRLIARAVDLGITYFDTADFYAQGGSETVLGRALKAIGVPRDQVVIATKVGLPVGAGVNDHGLSRRHIRHAVESSLRRLGTDYIDIYQMHRFDHHVPPGEVIAAFDDLVREGKVRYVGASTMHAWQFAQLLRHGGDSGRTRIVSMQLHYNLIYREEERDVIPMCRAEGVAVLPWSPLARGVLARAPGAVTARAKSDATAKRFYTNPSDADVIGRLDEIAGRRGASRAEVALAWLLHKPGVVAPVFGASRESQIEAACQAVELRLSEEDMRELEAPYGPHARVEHEYTPGS